jgi:hypothetical protein
MSDAAKEAFRKISLGAENTAYEAIANLDPDYFDKLTGLYVDGTFGREGKLSRKVKELIMVGITCTLRVPLGIRLHSTRALAVWREPARGSRGNGGRRRAGWDAGLMGWCRGLARNPSVEIAEVRLKISPPKGLQLGVRQTVGDVPDSVELEPESLLVHHDMHNGGVARLRLVSGHPHDPCSRVCAQRCLRRAEREHTGRRGPRHRLLSFKE